MRCPQWVWKMLLSRYSPPELRDARVSEGLSMLVEQYPNLPASDDTPIFIFSAGWRSGSTLLQRLLNSHPEVMIWGEAYENTFLLHHLAAPFAGFTKVPLDFLFPSELPDLTPRPDKLSYALTRTWVATLSPEPADLKQASLAFMESLFKKYPAAMGRSRWGMKSVTGTEVLAKYLKWLYPRCKLLYLLRSPYSSFESYVYSTRDGAEPWYLHYPAYPVKGVVPFAVHWRRCVEGFLTSREEVGALLVRYESLADGSAVADLEGYLGLRLDRSVLEAAVDFPSERRTRRGITKTERALIRFIAGEAARRFGYAG